MKKTRWKPTRVTLDLSDRHYEMLGALVGRAGLPTKAAVLRRLIEYAVSKQDILFEGC